MTTIQPDGREGVRCTGCDAGLQAVQIEGEALLRCPWTLPGSQTVNRRPAVTQIHCNRPLVGARSTTGLYSVSS